VELAPNAKVNGTVYYRLLEMAMGAEVNGQLVHTEEEPVRMLGYDSQDESVVQETSSQSGESEATIDKEQEDDPPDETGRMLRQRRGR